MKKFKCKFRLKSAFLLLLAVFAISCSEDMPNPVIKINKSYSIDRCKSLIIEPTEKGFSGGTFLWKMSNPALNIKDSIIGHSQELFFVSLNTGYYQLVLTSKTADGSIVKNDTTIIDVAQEKIPYSPYLYKVYDFFPAVGQFTNNLPLYEEGDTHSDMVQKAEKAIAGENPTMVSLGGFGGYIIFGFDHTIVNIPGKRDFRVKGNAFYAAANPNPDAPKGGSCEPGIIMVAYDKNKNGLPDADEWYEIEGSEHKNGIKNYEITYYKPSQEADDASGNNPKYIKWEDNQGNTGYKEKNMFHAQSYYPEWTNDNKITFKGTLLPNNAIDESGEGTYWVLYAFEKGYVDNIPNNEEDSAIDIDWAIDSNGEKIFLPGIDFIKVYTGLNQECGWLGETSTEVAGATDLHLIKIYQQEQKQ